jgi:hypothetical protein
MHNKKSTMRKKYTSFASHFTGHENALVRFQAYCPKRQVWGYPRCHWMPPQGKYSPHTPADAMVINFKN